MKNCIRCVEQKNVVNFKCVENIEIDRGRYGYCRKCLKEMSIAREKSNDISFLEIIRFVLRIFK